MATAKLFLDTRNKNTKRFPLVLRIGHKSSRKDIDTGYSLLETEWNANKKVIKASYQNSGKANAKLSKKLSVALDTLSECKAVIKDLTVSQLAEIVEKNIDDNEKEKLSSEIRSVPETSKQTKLEDYGNLIIERYNKAKRYGMIKSFKGGINLFLKFHGDNTLLLSDIDKTFLEEIEADYLSRGDNNLNGLGVHLRAIRRIYNLAAQDKKTEINYTEHYPFGKGGYSIKSETTKKKAVKLDVIDEIRSLEYPIDHSLWHHRNYFLFMFNMRGMNFIDLAFLRVEAYKNNRLIYKRRKTKRGRTVKEFNIKLTEEAQKILDYYMKGKKKTDLIFPILEDVIDHPDEAHIYKVYEDKRGNHIRRLNSIGKAINIDTKLTTYVARHTFASAGLRKGVSKAQIGDMLGHTNYYTTEAYLNGFEQEVLDDAADQILG